MRERLTREEFIARQEKRRAEKKEIRNFALGFIAFIATSYCIVWLLSAIAMIG